MANDKFRLVTRGDFDGLVCAVLLKELDLIDDIRFVHPKDVRDGLIDIKHGDIVANLPYSKDASYVFDHHESEMTRVGRRGNSYNDPDAPSAARVVWNTFGGAERFKNVPADIMEAVDKADSANFTRDEILNPTGWTLLSFILDARTGLGRFRDFRISNYRLMMNLIDLCREKTVGEILRNEDVGERVDLYFAQQDSFVDQLKRLTAVRKNLAYVDLLNEDVVYAGNRFMIYALYPDVDVSMHAMWRVNGQKIVYAVGKSIFNRTNPVNIGDLMLRYGGGGHANVGACQIDLDKAARIGDELIAALTDAR
ncbi:MAG TPA: exopolyphosphatase [Alphaproteobacteria bacterium]|nr:exopolyphosphatase [Alphaproteobacteria bacterium]